MPIRIDEINAKGMGPISEFSKKMATVNLIYGSNEQGKTFLVEFIVKSLFKNLKEFNLRLEAPTGTISVSGLEKELITFSPKSKSKMENYLEKDNPGMPPNIARLLVVKGAELDLDEKSRGGVSKAIIKSFLSSQSTLDYIQNRIPKTLQTATIEAGIINGDNKGDVKKRNELSQKLSMLDELLSKLDQDFSSGNRASLRLQVDNLIRQREELKTAKRFAAWKVDKQIREVKAELDVLEVKGLDQLLNDMKTWEDLSRELAEERRRLEIARRKSEHYKWLESAISEYQSMLDRGGVSVKNSLLVWGGIAIFLGFACSSIGMLLATFKQPLVGILIFLVGMLALIGGVVLGFLQLRQVRKAQASQEESEELKRISKSYEEMCGKPLNDIVTLKTTQKNIEADYYLAIKLAEDADQDQTRLDRLEENISSCFTRFGFDSQDRESWKKAAETISKKQKELETTLNSLSQEQARLSIPSQEYLEADPGTPYSEAEMKRIETDLADISQKLDYEEDQLASLKIRIQTTLSDENLIQWEALIEKLHGTRLEVAREYASLTSKILASILVQNAITNARQQEDDNIRTNLESPVVTKPLQKITGRYQTIRMDDDKLKVADKFDEFGMDELSTGAREQVLLALRIGFASKLMGQDGAFLILDDAFQHSDWKRRVNLIEQTMELAKNGWQILYFSMDDHIKDLFDKYGNREFGDQYRSFDITKQMEQAI